MRIEVFSAKSLVAIVQNKKKKKDNTTEWKNDWKNVELEWLFRNWIIKTIEIWNRFQNINSKALDICW